MEIPLQLLRPSLIADIIMCVEEAQHAVKCQQLANELRQALIDQTSWDDADKYLGEAYDRLRDLKCRTK